MATKRTTFAGIALSTALIASLGLGASTANAAVSGTFGDVTTSNPGQITTPTTSTAKTKSITVSFNGPAVNTNRTYVMFDSAYDGPSVSIAKRNGGVSSAYVNKPYLDGPYTTLNPATTSVATFSAYKYTTPGQYKLTIPVSKRDYNTVTGTYTWTTLKTTKNITVNANPKTSKAETSAYGSGRAGKTFKASVTAPNYQAGAKVTAYYKAKGTSKWKKVKTTKLKKTNGYSSKANLNISKKHNVGGRGGKIYFKIGKVTFAGSYQTAAYNLKRY